MINCLFCGAPFQPGKPRAKFCSDKCRVYYHRRKNETQLEQKLESQLDKAKLPPETITDLADRGIAITKTQQGAKISRIEPRSPEAQKVPTGTSQPGRTYFGVPIPANLKGIDLSIWKKEIEEALPKKTPRPDSRIF